MKRSSKYNKYRRRFSDDKKTIVVEKDGKRFEYTINGDAYDIDIQDAIERGFNPAETICDFIETGADYSYRYL